MTGGDRVAFLNRECASNPTLREEVESLLAAEAGSFLTQPAVEIAAQAMFTIEPLKPGNRIGPYEIVSLLGSGGMGQVYRARDTRLKRTVAVKVLPPYAAGDAEQRKRLLNEARAVSALNHPNIVTIHDVLSDGERDALVMEYVIGETLQKRIGRRGLPLKEVLSFAIQIADALTAAHAAGIVHRDIKPGNIIVNENGLIKVLDFGLAKLTGLPEAGEFGPTQTIQPLTEEGTVLGTVAYMSPEQAEGKPLDARSDIFSFGAVLYEMTTGRRAFAGDSKAAIVAAVLNKEPSPPGETALEMPAELERLIRRCLRKDPSKRQQHIADVKVLLEELKEESESVKLATVKARKGQRRLWATATTLAIAAAGAGVWLRSGREEPQPHLVPLTTFAGNETDPSFSPDGNQVVFTWDGEKQNNADIYVKMIGSTTALRLTTDPSPDVSPAWSRDGRQIAFLRYGHPGSIYLISPLGGPEQKIGDFDAARGTPAWSPDGKFLVLPKSNSAPKTEPNWGALYLVPVQGGESRPLLIPEAGRYYLFPTFDPDGRSMAFASCTEVGPACDICLAALGADFLPQGRPRQIKRVAAELAGLAWAEDGRSLVYSAGTSINDYFLWRLDIAGGEPKRLEITAQEALFPAVAPKGRRLAFSRQMIDQDIWRVEVGGKPEPFLVSTMLDLNPQFSPDGRHIAFASARSVDRVSVWLSDANGGNLAQLTRGPGTYDGSPRWSPDGRWIAFDALGNDGRRSVHVVDSAGGPPRHLTSGFPASNKVPSWSRDGKRVYFTSDRTGRWEIWRIPTRGGEAEQITSEGGYVALESRDGKTLYYTKTGTYGGEPLYARRLGGTEERQVLERVVARAFDVFEDGIYYLAPTGARTAEVRFHEFATERSRSVSAIDAQPGLGLSVSPNRRTILFTKYVSAGIDLMLIENFR